MFLYLSTGAGHVSAARALAKELEERYDPDEVEIHLFDGIPEGGSEFQRTLVEKGYRFCTLTIPALWTIIYQSSNIPFVMNIHTKSMSFFSTKYIRKYIRKHNITRVVNIHFLLTRPLFRALRQLKRLDMPVVTVVTDPFTAHPMWYYRQFSPMVVFSERAHKEARKYLRWMGLPNLLLPRPRTLVTLPPILNKKFDKRLPDQDCARLRSEYGYDSKRRLVLIAGGGEGLPRGEKYLETLAKAGLDIQIAYVCGRNRSQWLKIREIAEHYPQVSITVYGFVSFMYELMNMADVIVTKAGPATVYEALLLQKPLIITQRLYGQEQGNVDFVVHNKLGWFTRKPSQMVAQLEEILAKPTLFNQTIENIQRKQLHNGTSEIAQYIMNLPREPEKRNKLMDMLYKPKSS